MVYQGTASAKFEAAISIIFINFFAKKSNKMCKKDSILFYHSQKVSTNIQNLKLSEK